MLKLSSIKQQLIIFLSFFAAYLSVINKDAAFLFGLSVAVISAAAADSLLIYLKDKKVNLDDSSVISGLIIGFVLSNAQPWWIFVLASITAILSKHLIRINNKHIFNPAGLGVFLAVLFFHGFTQWKGASAWYIMIPFGIYFVYKAQKLEIIISYILAYFLLFGAQAFGYLNYFFVSLMLIEPKTTPIKRKGKIIFGLGAAVTLFILTKFNFRYEAEICSLLVMNLFVPLLNKTYPAVLLESKVRD